MGKTLLEKISGAKLKDLGQGVKDMFDLDSSKKGLEGLGDKALGAAAIGVPAAVTYKSVAKTNADNPKISNPKAVRDSTGVGLTAGGVDGAMLGILHRSKNTLGEGAGGLGKRLAIYGGVSALINGAIAHHIAKKEVEKKRG